MNTANLQLQGLYIVVASLSSALVRKGVLSREELDSTLRTAEERALSFRTKELAPSNREAVAFPARLLRMANIGEGDGELQGFSELAKMVGELSDDEETVESLPARGEGKDQQFYTSENGDQWDLVTDVGGRRFVRHTPTPRSGGQIEVTDLEAFREREPHSIQNQRLEEMLFRQEAASN
jgi:hypothetical protein